MDKKKNDAPAVQSNNASSVSSISSSTSIAQNTAGKQGFLDGGKKKKSWDKSKCRCLPIDAKVYSLAIKVYDEQLLYGWDFTCNAIRVSDSKHYHIIGIKHFRDTYSDGGLFWKPAIEKPHYHIILRCGNRKERIRVKNALEGLGIYFRPGDDDWLWANHGVEAVGNFGSYATYLTHETEAAIADGKELYFIDELVSNLTEDEIVAVREGYIRVSTGTRKVTPQELVELDDTAYKLGYDLKNFDAWYGSLSFNIRSHSKMKTIRESYNRGVSARITDNSEVLRLCVYIKGEPNSGKTYASKHALAGKAIHVVEGGKTGKFDDLRPDHDAIIVSDDTCPNPLNMTDNYICRAYKRQNNNPAWAGNYFIVTSNLSFEEWLVACKISTKSKHYQAMISRFYICEIKQRKDGTNYLALQSASTRGSKEEQMQRVDMFMDFKSKFDATIKNYHPDIDTVDYSSLIDPSYKEEVEEHNAEVAEREKQLKIEADATARAERERQEEFLRGRFEVQFGRKPKDYECTDYEWMKQCLIDGKISPLYNPDSSVRDY